MKLLRIIVLAACAAYGAIIGGANLAQATPMNGLLPAAHASLPVEHVQFPCVFPFNCGYGYYGRGYYGRGYYGHAAIMGTAIMGTATMGTTIMGAAIADRCSPV